MSQVSTGDVAEKTHSRASALLHDQLRYKPIAHKKARIAAGFL
jgi:hypothetical protein